jgi:hypothetical protein
MTSITNAIANRSLTYSPSTFEILTLARFFKIDIRIRIDGLISDLSVSDPPRSHYLLLQRTKPPPEPIALVWARTPPNREFTLLHRR